LDGAASLTKVKAKRPATVSPNCCDKSSVAKSRSYTSVSNSHPDMDRTIHALARGTMARNEPMNISEGV
jgi:hypothetical protein